ncbi:MAG: type II secretion system F family protein [Anaerolineales bacterium]|nr:type II secretion system F family protein [Anaerolineales bacterium]NUQ83860.1 type II secretion system F family protein [Anaerolineales bacterium]
MNLILIGGALILILLIVGVVVTIVSERSLVDERLGQFEKDEEAREAQQAAVRSIVTDWLNRRVASSSMGDRIARELARADLKLKVAEYYALIVISTVGVGLVALLLQPNIWYISFAIGAVIGFFLPRFYVRQQQVARIRKFDDQLGDMLNLMVNGLRAGYSTMQAMEAVSRELPSPISDEFRRVVQEMQIGIPMEKALDNLLRRIPSDDLDFVVTAINVQREVGGNLSEILDTISFTIRERVRIKGEIRVMTANVRASGGILSMIPIGLALALWFISPEYIGQFFAENGIVPQPACGIIAISVIVGLIVSGYFVMQKIADIEV